MNSLNFLVPSNKSQAKVKLLPFLSLWYDLISMSIALFNDINNLSHERDIYVYKTKNFSPLLNEFPLFTCNLPKQAIFIKQVFHSAVTSTHTANFFPGRKVQCLQEICPLSLATASTHIIHLPYMKRKIARRLQLVQVLLEGKQILL